MKFVFSFYLIFILFSSFAFSQSLIRGHHTVGLNFGDFYGGGGVLYGFGFDALRLNEKQTWARGLSFEYYKFRYQSQSEANIINPLNFTLNRFFGKKKSVYLGWTAGFSLIEAHNKSSIQTANGFITETKTSVVPFINTSLYLGTRFALNPRLSCHSQFKFGFLAGFIATLQMGLTYRFDKIE